MFKQSLIAVVSLASFGALSASADDRVVQINQGGSRTITFAVHNTDPLHAPYGLTGERAVSGQSMGTVPVRLSTQSFTVAPGWVR